MTLDDLEKQALAALPNPPYDRFGGGVSRNLETQSHYMAVLTEMVVALIAVARAAQALKTSGPCKGKPCPCAVCRLDMALSAFEEPKCP